MAIDEKANWNPWIKAFRERYRLDIESLISWIVSNLVRHQSSVLLTCPEIIFNEKMHKWWRIGVRGLGQYSKLPRKSIDSRRRHFPIFPPAQHRPLKPVCPELPKNSALYQDLEKIMMALWQVAISQVLILRSSEAKNDIAIKVHSSCNEPSAALSHPSHNQPIYLEYLQLIRCSRIFSWYFRSSTPRAGTHPTCRIFLETPTPSNILGSFCK
jgi:hypothetical protein